MTDHIALREFIETIIKLHEQRRDELRAEDDRRLKEKFTALADALTLQAAAYPTVKDFNDLKTHVDVELAARSGSSSAVDTLFKLLSAMALIISCLVGYLVYASK